VASDLPEHPILAAVAVHMERLNASEKAVREAGGIAVSL
jgi:hypothetical protein